MKPADALAEAARALGATSAPGAPSFVGEELGVRYVARIDDDDGVPHRLAVDVLMPGLAEVAFEPEGDFARLGKRLGLSTEIQLGDPAFDPHVYVETDVDEAVARSYLASADARAAIAEIIRGGDDVRLTSHGAHAWLRSEHGFDAPRLVRVVRALCRFVASLPKPLPTFSPEPAPPRWPFRLGIALHVALWLGFGASTSSATQPFVLAWGIGLAVNLVLTVLSVPLLVARYRRRSSGFETILVMAVVIFLFLLPIGPTVVNLWPRG